MTPRHTHRQTHYASLVNYELQHLADNRNVSPHLNCVRHCAIHIADRM